MRPTYSDGHGTPEPTHDATRDISGTDEVFASYDLGAGRRRKPRVATSFNGAQLSVAVEEQGDSLPAGRRAIEARSGNASWDDADDTALAGPEQRGGEDPGMPVATVIAIGSIAFIAYWLIWGRKND